MEDPEYAYRKSRYEGYIRERDALRKDALEISGRYDKAILALAGGALALSITFLEKIAPHPSFHSIVVLAIAWMLLIAAVLLELWALALSQELLNLKETAGQSEYQMFLQNLPEVTADETVVLVSQNLIENKAKNLGRVNVASRWTLAFGIVLLCLFSLLNLPSPPQENMSKPNQTLSPAPAPPAPTTTTTPPTSKGSYVPPANVLPPPPPPAPPKP